MDAELRGACRGTAVNGVGPCATSQTSFASHAARTALVGLMGAFRSDVDPDMGRVSLGDQDAVVPPYLSRFRRTVRDGMTGQEALNGVTGALGDLRQRLVASGHLPPASVGGRVTVQALACMTPSVLLAAWAWTGAPDPTAGTTLALTRAVIVAFLVTVMAARGGHVGEALLAGARETASRAARAPMPGELAFAYSLAGPDALAGTFLSGLRGAFQPRRSKETDSSPSGDAGGDPMASLGWFGNSFGCDASPTHSGGTDGGHGHTCGSGGYSCGGGGHSCGSSCGGGGDCADTPQRSTGLTGT